MEGQDDKQEEMSEDLFNQIRGPSTSFGGGSFKKPAGLGLNLDAITKDRNDSKVAQMKESLYDDYKPLSSRKGDIVSKAPNVPVMGGSMVGKPKFNL